MSLVRFAVFKVKLSRVPAVARNVNMIGVHNSCNHKGGAALRV